MRRRMLWAMAAASAIAGLANGADAEDFRIETKVFVGDAAEPLSSNLTLFHAGVVFDFLNDPTEEIAVFDPRQGHFTLIDIRRRIKTRIERDVLLEFIAEMKVRAANSSPLARASAEPKFTPDFDEFSRTLTLKGDIISYGASGERFPTPAAQ
ncbi:MAG: hypothetical protein KDA41_07685, partial [Planctomycetales bacterium]|nr:hypothetical protein [Planctomycetales bacterium]